MLGVFTKLGVEFSYRVWFHSLEIENRIFSVSRACRQIGISELSWPRMAFA